MQHMEEHAPYIAVAGELGLEVDKNNFALQKKILIEKVNHLILTDFEKLVSILYRVDVSEQKINTVLKMHADQNAAELIVDLLLERAAQKIKSREQWGQRDDSISEEEKW